MLYLVLLALLSGCVAKLVDGYAKLSAQDTEHYITKFAFNPLVPGYINGTFTVESTDREYFDEHQHQLMLCLYDDHEMPKFSRMMTAGSLCQERARICSWQTRIRPANTAADKHHFTFASGVSNRRDVKSAHYWYAVLMDCYLEEYDAHPPRLHYALQFLNGNPNSLQSSHLPADENGMQTINALALAAMVAYGAIFGMSLYTRWLNIQQAHLIVVLFMAAYVLQANPNPSPRS